MNIQFAHEVELYGLPDGEEDWETLLHSQTVCVPAILPESLRRENLYETEECEPNSASAP